MEHRIGMSYVTSKQIFMIIHQKIKENLFSFIIQIS